MHPHSARQHFEFQWSPGYMGKAFKPRGQFESGETTSYKYSVKIPVFAEAA